MTSLPSGTVTLLFCDVEGSTRLVTQLRERYASLIDDYVRLLTAAAEQGDGVLIDQTGDGLFFGFPTARGALTAATAAQHALHGHRWPGEAEVHVRMGLHTGEPMAAATRYVGLDVHRAARICSAGHGGQILLSESVRSLIDQLPEGHGLRDLGVHHLKDLETPIHLYQATAPGLIADFPPIRTLETLPNNLPRRLSSFVGRRSELEEAHRRLGSTPLLTLTGTGGVGKTRLALQLAAEALEEFPGGVWLVELEPLADPELVLPTIATALRVSEQPGSRLIETVAARLGEQASLLLIDNCEHVVDGVAPAAAELLQRAPELRILATSREALGVEGEALLPVASMSLPAPGREAPHHVVDTEAGQLFMERAAAVVPTFRLTDQNAPAVGQLCRRLDGIPLAIELAAARVTALSPEQIAARLDDRFRLLTGGSRTTLARHRTLRATLDWSYDLLTEPEQLLFRRLSVFAGGFSLEAAEAIGGTPPLDPVDVLDLIARLVDKSLVVAEPARAEGRYRMLETIRDYARDRLMESGETEMLSTRHRDWYVRFVDRAKGFLYGGPDAAAWLERIGLEHDNIRAALRWSHELPSATEEELRLVAGLWRFWEISGMIQEGRDWLQRALDRPGARASTLRANALTGAGMLARLGGDLEASAAFHEESLVIHRQLGGPGVSYALTQLATVALDAGDLERARGLYAEALALLEEGGDRRATAFAHINLADVIARQGDPESARTHFEQSVELLRSLGEPLGEAYAMSSFARILAREGHLEDARQLCQGAFEIHERLGDRRGVALCLTALADVSSAEGDTESAVRLYRQSLELREAIGDRASLAPTLERLARAVHTHDAAWAASLLGTAGALRASTRTTLPLGEREAHDALVATLRATLGEEELRRAWAAGQSRSAVGAANAGGGGAAQSAEATTPP